MLPLAKCPCAFNSRTSASVTRASARSLGLLKLIITCGTAVEIKNKSAPSCSASSADTWSLSITASTPRSLPPLRRTTGMPPPPHATTKQPLVHSARIESSSMISRGIGEGTTQRQPRPASSFTRQPSSASRLRAVASSMKDPIGFAGSENAASSSSTRTCVTTVATERCIPRALNSFSSAF